MAKKPSKKSGNGKVDSPSHGKWPADRIRRLQVKDLVPYARNARLHTEAQVGQLAESITKFGFTNPVIVASDGEIIAGHGRVMAAKQLGLSEVPGVTIEPGEWTDEDRRAYRLWDNQSGLLSSWDEDTLKIELKALKLAEYPMQLIGFPDVQLVQFLSGVPGESAESGDGVDRGALLELIKITIAEPKHQVAHGDHYLLGERHRLLCVGVIADWARWVPLLTAGALFCPYPGVFVPFGEKGKTHPLIMVQPDTYIAGHILDRYSEVEGAKAVKKVS